MNKFVKIFISLPVLLPISLYAADFEYICPQPTDIKYQDQAFPELRAKTQYKGTQVDWVGWVRASEAPTKFVGVYFLGGTFVTCQYATNDGSYAQLSPELGKYVVASVGEGPWSSKDTGIANCRSDNASECTFLLKENN